MTATPHVAVFTASPPQASLSVSRPNFTFLSQVSSAFADFDSNLHLMLADSHELLMHAHHAKFLRFCTGKKPYESAENYPNQLYVDRYDKHSLWTLVGHRSAGCYVGAVRFILKRHGQKLQFQKKHKLPAFIRRNGLVVAEISSFLAYCDGIKLKETRFGSGFGQIGLHLMKACFQMGAIANPRVDVVCGLMCPALLRMFEKCGVKFEPVGDVVEFHGIRQPCWGMAKDLLVGIKNVDPKLYNFVKPNQDYLDYLGVTD